MYPLLSLLTGVFIAVMVSLNGTLQSGTGVTESLIIIHTAGFFTASLLYLLLGKKNADNSEKKTPKYYLCAGMLGVAVVFLNNAVFLQGGVLAVLSGTLAGQIIAAILLERTGFMPQGKSPVIHQIVSAALVLPGAVIVLASSGLTLFWMTAAFVPGFLLMVQSYINSRNSKTRGQRITILYNFGSGLVLAIILFFIFNSTGSIDLHILKNIPILILIGGGFLGVFVIFLSNLLLTKATVITVVLGIYAGQICAGIGVDLFLNIPIYPAKIFGAVLLLLGLGADKLPLQLVRKKIQ
ncbi:MAG: DMT family transporter [Spirochaetia bacterium]